MRRHKTKGPRYIIWDLETLPDMVAVMNAYAGLSDWPGKTFKADLTSIICAGWKVLGEKRVHCINAWDFPEWRKDVNNDKKLCLAISKILNGADAIVTHNGVRFDWKHLATRMEINGLKPLPEIVHVDTCQVLKSKFLLSSNSLQNAAGVFLKDKKLKHEGWGMWVKAWQRDSKAMKEMTKYCKKDVLLLEQLYMRLRPYTIKKISAQANHNILNPTKHPRCPVCGSGNIIRNGIRFNGVTKMQRLQCHDCGAPSKMPLEKVGKANEIPKG